MNGQACLDIFRSFNHDVVFRRNGVPSRIVEFQFHCRIGAFWFRYDSQQLLPSKTSSLEPLAQFSVCRNLSGESGRFKNYRNCELFGATRIACTVRVSSARRQHVSLEISQTALDFVPATQN